MSRKAGCIVGLGCLVIAAALVVTIWWATKKTYHAVINGLDDWARQDRQAATWFPPAKPDDPTTWLPPIVGRFQLRKTHLDSEPAELHVDIRPVGGRYVRGNHAVEVRIYKVNELENEALRHRVQDAVEAEDSHSETRLGTSNYDSFSYTVDGREGLMWWRAGWLMFFRTKSGVDLDAFGRAYRTAVSGPPPKVSASKARQ